MSNYTYRLRSPKGLDTTLLKELKFLGIKESQMRKIPGRKAIEVKGEEKLLWDILAKSRIVENVM